MEWAGWISLMIMLCFVAYPARVRSLEKKVKRLQRKVNGGTDMSKIFNDLVGKECIMKTDEGLSFAGSTSVKCQVIDVDDEWIKFSYMTKKEGMKTKIMRIDAIDSVDVVE